MRQYEEEKMLIGSDNKFIAWNILFYYGRLCKSKTMKTKTNTKIEQNLDKKEDAEDFNKKDEEADENKKVKKMRCEGQAKIQGKPEFIMLMT